MGKGTIIGFLGLVAYGILLPFPAGGVTIRDDVPDSSYVNLAAGSDYASVGTFVNSWGYTGSGILIAPDWILTAAHNFSAASSGTFSINGVSYGTTALISNPGWNGNPLSGYDFGLAHLSMSVAGVSPATLYTGSSETGQTGTFVGFGITGTGLTGYQTLDNQKRAFQNVIDGDFGNSSVLLGSDFDNPHTTTDNVFGDSTSLNLEGCVTPGDSGGGVFLTLGSQTYLAGVISFVGSNDGNSNGDYGDVSGFGRVSSFEPWITSTIPEPSAAAVISLGALNLLLVRKILPRK